MKTEPTGELQPRHVKALSQLIREYDRAFPGSDLAKRAKAAMREVREAAAQDKYRRKYGF